MKKTERIIMSCFILLLISVLLITILCERLGFFEEGPKYPEAVDVPILMFHDVAITEGGTWSISAENFRETLQFLIGRGYTPISLESLMEYADGGDMIPQRSFCVTFDDGYYSAYSTVLPIITEMNVPITIFMNGRSVRDADEKPSTDKANLTKLSREELRELEESPLVSIQSHSFALHGKNTKYSVKKRDNALPLSGESEKNFKSIFNEDCRRSEKFLNSIGATESLVYSYPNGKHHTWTEQVLKERGYRITLTTNYSHRNVVERGKPETLYLLGRMNVNDSTTIEQLLRYIER